MQRSDRLRKVAVLFLAGRKTSIQGHGAASNSFQNERFGALIIFDPARRKGTKVAKNPSSTGNGAVFRGSVQHLRVVFPGGGIEPTFAGRDGHACE